MGGGARGSALGANNNVTNTLPARVTMGPTGRHFKPFDHRRMNPMAEIQEDSNAEPIYQQRTANNCGTNLIVQKSTQGLPHLPSEVRHTNYKKMANPHIMEHRDSANFSMASSSDSG